MAAQEREVPLNHILTFKEDVHSLANGESLSMVMREPVYEMPRRRGALRSFLETFRRDSHARMTPGHAFVGSHGNMSADSLPTAAHAREHHGRNYYDIQAANYRTAHPLLAKELKGRHLQMIAIGGSIGTGLFISSGSALNTGGPASVLLAYLTIGAMLYCVMQALGELAVVFPIAGSFSAYSTRFLDPAWGFAMGWK